MPVRYVPILKGKEGEYGALEELSPNAKDVILPLVEIPNVPYDYAKERPAKSLDDHLAGIADRLKKCWAERSLYIDMPWFGEDDHVGDGTMAIASVLRDCTDRDVDAIPVLRTSSSSDYIQAVAAHVRACGESFCLRLVERDFDEELDNDLEATVNQIADKVGVPSLASCDLIVDLGDVGADASRATLVARSVLSQIPRSGNWRQTALAAASFPENLSDVSASTTSHLPRVEWQSWERIVRRRSNDEQNLVFGDYAISHPIPAELDPRTMRMSASIRYTTTDSWLIVKGRNVRQYGFDQYYELATELVRSADYSGEKFSWGDAFIARCARRETGPGNATTWRKVGTNHHLTLVAAQLHASDHPVA